MSRWTAHSDRDYAAETGMHQDGGADLVCERCHEPFYPQVGDNVRICRRCELLAELKSKAGQTRGAA